MSCVRTAPPVQKHLVTTSTTGAHRQAGHAGRPHGRTDHHELGDLLRDYELPRGRDHRVHHRRAHLRPVRRDVRPLVGSQHRSLGQADVNILLGILVPRRETSPIAPPTRPNNGGSPRDPPDRAAQATEPAGLAARPPRSRRMRDRAAHATEPPGLAARPTRSRPPRDPTIGGERRGSDVIAPIADAVDRVQPPRRGTLGRRVMLRLADDLVIAPDRAARRRTAARFARFGRASGLLAFRVADMHIHLVAVGARATAT